MEARKSSIIARVKKKHMPASPCVFTFAEHECPLPRVHSSEAAVGATDSRSLEGLHGGKGAESSRLVGICFQRPQGMCHCHGHLVRLSRRRDKRGPLSSWIARLPDCQTVCPVGSTFNLQRLGSEMGPRMFMLSAGTQLSGRLCVCVRADAGRTGQGVANCCYSGGVSLSVSNQVGRSAGNGRDRWRRRHHAR